MKPLTTIRTLAFASMLAFSIISVPAVHVHALPRDGGAAGADTRPDNATCEFVTQGFWDCTTPDGGEWYCTNATDPTACVQVKTPNPSLTIAEPGLVHPVFGGVLAPVSSPTLPTTHLPVRSVLTTAP